MEFRTLLINMPFASATAPSIALGLLQAQLHDRSLECDCEYLNVAFAGDLGYDEYVTVAETWPTTTLVGEWLFAHAAFPHNSSSLEDYERVVDKQAARAFDEADRKLLRRAKGLVQPFLARTMARIDVAKYAIVGFTSMFHQQLASLALARMIKDVHPAAKIVFGGANCEGEMGMALLRVCPFVDYVCLGEGDVSFPLLVTSLSKGENPTIVGNIASREGLSGCTERKTPATRVFLDGLPIPNYDAFVNAQRTCLKTPRIHVPVEFSRGCWWGAKHHCTFCGLNGSTMRYASKSPARVMMELTELAERYGRDFLVVDNIIDMAYLSTVFPMLASEGRRYSLFVETKANLRKDQLKILKSAGACMIQPGIESLSTHVLQLMRKGVSMLQNVQTLKWCKEIGITPSWNLLRGFPGERAADYEDMLGVMPLVRHLPPPTGTGCVRVDRFSPFFENPEAFGLSGLHAIEVYGCVYPFATTERDQLAYYFGCSYSEPLASNDYAGELRAEVVRWQTHASCVSLTHEMTSDGVVVCDTRAGAANRFLLSADAGRLLLECDGIRSVEHIAGQRDGDPESNRTTVAAALTELLERRVILMEAGKVLALTIPLPTVSDA